MIMEKFKLVLWCLLVAFAAAFAWAMFASKDNCIFLWLMGISPERLDILQFISWGMSGLLAAIIAIALHQRAEAMANHNTLIAKGHIDERFKVAVESLGSNRPPMRIAAFYQFYHLATDRLARDGFAYSILRILCADVRHTTSISQYREVKGLSKPTEECQSLLSIIFGDTEDIFTGMFKDLKGAYLVRADLRNAKAEAASFSGANLRKAIFDDANLQKAHFAGANLEEASFVRADMRESHFVLPNYKRANIIAADFSYAKLQGADLSSVDNGQATIGLDTAEVDETTKAPWGYYLHKNDMGKYSLREGSPPEE